MAKVKWEGLFIGGDCIVKFNEFIPAKGRRGRRIEAAIKKEVYERTGRWPQNIIFSPTLPGRALIEGEIKIPERTPFNPVIKG